MQSFLLAFALVLAAGSAVADPAPILEPESVPPIPAPGEQVEPVAPLDGPWPVAPGEPLTVSDASGSPMALPPIPAPIPQIAQSPADIAQSTVPPIPAPGERVEPVAPLDGPWPAAPADPVSVADASGAPLALPSIPAPIATAAAEPAPQKARPTFDPRGTIHVVQKGDTLWDISDLYLGTPWIWPSVWRDNQAIENPHLILPGDKIWVSATEMRKVTDAEAAELLAGLDDDEDGDESVPAALAEDVPSVPMPKPPPETFHYMEMATVGVVTPRELKGYARVVGTTAEAIFLSQGHTVFVDLGPEDAAVGDEFVIFRTGEKVHDPGTKKVIGRHSEVVGWLEITAVHDEASRAVIRMAYADILPSQVYLKPREPVPTEIAVQDSPEGVEGQIVDLLIDPKYRGGGDVVILNRGSQDGLQPGSPLEVYRPVSATWKKTWYGRQPDVEIPHEVVGELLVLSVQPKTAMAYLRKTKANTELWYGDRFRTVGGPSVEWPRGGIFAIPLAVLDVIGRIPQPSLPDIDVPDEVAGWNVPRLSLPGLDAYDPR